MASFQIAQNPTFSAAVKIPRIGGDPLSVPFEFQYRSRKELAALFVGWSKRLEADKAAFEAKGDDLTIADVTDSDIERQIDQVQALVVGWGFDDAFTPESVRALVETSQGAGQAIVDAYQGAFTAARLGNS